MFVPPPDEERPPPMNPAEDPDGLPGLPPSASNLEPELWPSEVEMEPEERRPARRASPAYWTTEFLLTVGCVGVNAAAALALLLTRRIGGSDAALMLGVNGGTVSAYVLGRSWVKARGGRG